MWHHVGNQVSSSISPGETKTWGGGVTSSRAHRWAGDSLVDAPPVPFYPFPVLTPKEAEGTVSPREAD